MSTPRFNGTTAFVIHYAREACVELTSPRVELKSLPQEIMLHKPSLEDLQALARLGHSASQATLLNLSGALNTKAFKDVVMRKKAVEAIATYVKKNHLLQELCLDRHTFSRAEADILMEALSISSVQRLYLRHCTFEKNYSITQIINAMKNSSHFQFINLAHSIKPAQIREYGRALVNDFKSIQTKIVFDRETNIAIQTVMEEYYVMSPRSMKTPRERKFEEPIKEEKELPSESEFIYFDQEEERMILTGRP